MTPKRATIVLAAILLLVIVAGIGAFYLGDKMLKQRSAAISEKKAELQAVETAVNIFEDSKSKVATYGYVNDLASKILPESKSQSEVVAELTQFAQDNNMQIQTLTFAAGDGKVTDPNLSQTQTVEGLTGVRVLQASLQFAGEPPITYVNFLNFLRKIETNQRKMEVTTLTITPDPANPQNVASATVTVNIFLKDTAPPVVEKKPAQKETEE